MKVVQPRPLSWLHLFGNPLGTHCSPLAAYAPLSPMNDLTLTIISANVNILGHWLNLNIQVGYFQLWQLLRDLPAAADPKLRDITPLRLMSWLSYQLSPRTHLLIKECMSEFAQIEPVQSDKIFQIGRFHLAGVGQAWKTWNDIRDAVIDEVTIHGKAQQPAVIVRLIRGFLQRLPLPRLFHFLNLVLPQMVPVCSSAQTTGFQFPGSQLIRNLWLERDEGVFVQEPEVMLMRLFASHAGIVHFRVEWKGKPLLLFADMKAKEYSSAWSYQNAKAVITTGQNVTMGLKKSNTVLLHYQFHGQLYQAIWQIPYTPWLKVPTGRCSSLWLS